ncbi:classical arabinogalactan protein 9-like [Neophocaena asiaeorientalis asiaeorientalis]|uniref:Classical arabinogalactan protein 9-like n=1 Tax=Neophocaena asiaeorientalis asiaeorientalis TaxID=1706337 RepID=A0A341CGV7_NEOAA|nr:classical arabinogalactan protein 9-like [Neophocaena asiaeorientalis asiaeorientalis]
MAPGQARPGSGPGTQGAGGREPTQLSAPRAASAPGLARPSTAPARSAPPPPAATPPRSSVPANHVSASGSSSPGRPRLRTAHPEAPPPPSTAFSPPPKPPPTSLKLHPQQQLRPERVVPGNPNSSALADLAAALNPAGFSARFGAPK